MTADKIVNIRVSEEMKKSIQEAAKKEGVNVSQYLRLLVVKSMAGVR